jgi:hypothetical protein
MKFNHFENAPGETSSNQTTSVRIEAQSDSVDQVFFSCMHPSADSKQTQLATAAADARFLIDTIS